MERKIQLQEHFSGGLQANPRCCQAECLNGGILKVEMTHRSICFPLFPARAQAERYSRRER